jgi:TPP-dependent indolepyruvate ferredoxin oxidoreductase alpha subunit
MAEQGYESYRDFRGAVLPHITPAPQLTLYKGHAEIDPEKCTACGLCLRIGHCYAIGLEQDKKARVNPADCTGCSTCVDICPAGAASMRAGEKLIN